MGKNTKFALYCTCGSAMVGNAKPAARAESLVEMWQTLHKGEGHSPCDAKTAAAARRKADRESPHA